MYGDTAVIRRQAGRLREQGLDIRAEGRSLRGRIETTEWVGQAADAMRAAAERRLLHLEATARKHDEAADALERHAVEVDRLKEVIAAIERTAQHLVAAARERISALGDQLLSGVQSLTPDPVDQLLDRFVPPPPGHLDWLRVDLPGLH